MKFAGFHEINTIFHNFIKSNTILLKATEFIEIQQNSKELMNSNRILLRSTKFYRISLNSLQISLQILLQISLWMSFMDFTADFITDFTAVFIMNFTANFMLNLPDFIINFMTISLHTSTSISLKSTRFHEIHSISHDFTEINRISLWISLWIPFQ